MTKVDKGFTTLDSEVQIENVPVQGTLPDWLCGTLLRNGPAKFEVGSQKYNHWFDGLAMIHKFSFAHGQVCYANKYLQSNAYTKAKKAGKICYKEFGTDPCRSIFKRVFNFFFPKFTDNAVVNITRLSNRLVALTETPVPIEFDLKTLGTLGAYQYDDQCAARTATAHPHYDFARKQTLGYFTSIARTSKYHVYNIAHGSSKRNVIGSFEVDKPCYMHSFGLSDRYAILTEYPLVLNPLRVLFGSAPIDAYEWQPQRGARFFVIDRSQQQAVKIYEAPLAFCFHHVNAFERSEKLFVDLLLFDDATIVKSLYLERLREENCHLPFAKLVRCCLPLDGSSMSCEEVCEVPMELPRINYQQNNTREYQFVYGISQGSTQEFYDGLVKLDISNRTTKTWHELDCYPGEPVFISEPGAEKEDGGVVLSVVLNQQKNNSFLLVLDATNFEEIARAEVPHHIPFGFHGQYFSS